MDEHLLRYDEEKEIVFVDCETLNLCLHSCHNLPWQISMIKLKGGKKVAEKDFYIKWDSKLKISKEAARITRYSQTKMDRMGVKPEEVFPTIQDWLDNCDYIAGHNVLGFDFYLLKHLYARMGQKHTHLAPKTIDTHCLAKGVKIGSRIAPNESLLAFQYRMLHIRKRGIKTNLAALGKEFEIKHNPDKLHDALVDLELNIKVWNKLKWMIEV